MQDESPNDKTLLEFPCEFPIKMMGRDTPEFHSVVRSLVEAYTGPLADESITAARSRKGQFVSITIVVPVTSKQQLDDIYRAITACDDVLMAL